MALPARSPNLNAFAERWVRSVKEECLSKLILFGEGPLSRTLAEFSAVVARTSGASRFGEKSRSPDSGRIPIPVLDDLQIRAHRFPQVRREHA